VKVEWRSGEQIVCTDLRWREVNRADVRKNGLHVTADQLPIIVLYGPTASGKSALAIGVAQLLAEAGRPAELITADALQIYRGMDIGTAKPSKHDQSVVPHHLIDVCDPFASESFTVESWLIAAAELIAAMRARGVVPIIVGGTGLYVQSLLFGMFAGPKADVALRAELAAMDPPARHQALFAIDPVTAARLHPSDDRRIIRGIEVFRLTGVPISTLAQQWEGAPPRADARLFILEWAKDLLSPRINARVKQMFAAGLVSEVASLCQAGELNLQAREAIGYKQLIPLLDPRRHPERQRGWVPTEAQVDAAAEQVKIETRRLAKNQRTWARKMQLRASPRLLDAGINIQANAQLVAQSVLSSQ